MFLKKPETIIKSLVHNGLSLLAIRATILASSALITLILIRRLGTEGFGSYTAVSNIYALFFPFVLFGIGNVITREIAKNHSLSQKYFISSLWIGLGLTVLVTISLVLFCRIVAYPLPIQSAAMVLAVGLFPNFIIQISESHFVGLEKVKVFALANFFFSLAELGLIFLFLALGYGIMGIAVSLVLIRCFFAASMVVSVLRTISWESLKPDISFAFHLLKVSSVFAVAGILAGLLFEIDILFLSKISGVHATGIYSAAYKLMNLWTLAITSFIGVFYPIASQYYETGREDFRRVCMGMYRYLLLTIFLAIVMTLSVGREVIALLFGSQYLASVEVLNRLIFLLIPLCGTPFMGLVLAASQKQKFDLFSISIAAAMSFVLHYFLVTRFGYFGSVYANILTFTMLQALQLFFVHRFIFKIDFRKNIVAPFIALLGTLFFLHWIGDWPWWIKGAMVFSVYALSLLVLRLISREDMKLFTSPVGVAGETNPLRAVRGIHEIRENEYRLLYDNGKNVKGTYEISVVTPNYNRGRLLENMLLSLVRQEFDLSRIEMVIVDDGGEAREVEMIEKLNLPFRARYFWQEHKGRRVGRVRNIGVKNACGEIVLFLDSDALCSPALLKEHDAEHRKRQKHVFLGDTFDLKKGERPIFKKYGSLDSMYANPLKFFRHYLKREYLLPLVYDLKGFSRGLCFCTLHASAKRASLLHLNGFDEGLDGRWGDEDLELGYRLEKLGHEIRWSGSSFVYHQWHPIHFNIRNLDNRLRILLKHPEVIPAKKIGGLENPFRNCSVREIKRLDFEEAIQEKTSSFTAGANDLPRYQVLYDNLVHASLKPEISLIVPTYNRRAFLEGFLETVSFQTLDSQKFEVVIADDGSSDESLEFIRSKTWPFRLVYVSQEHRGFRLSRNRNNGIEASRGEMIVIADVDVLLPKNFLEVHYRRHLENDRIAFAGLSYYLQKYEKLSPADFSEGTIFHSRFIRLRPKLFLENLRQNYFKHLAERGRFPLGTCFSGVHGSFKRKDFFMAGKFDEDFDGIWGDEDIEFGHRLSKNGVKIEFLNETLVYHRWHPVASSRKWAKENRFIFLIKHQDLLKQRLINKEVNHYYGRTISDLRCFYLWTKRLRRLHRLPPSSLRHGWIRTGTALVYWIFWPAFLFHLSNLFHREEENHAEEIDSCCAYT